MPYVIDTITAEKINSGSYILNGKPFNVLDLTEVTYSELTDLINTDSLSEGSFYLIKDFKTCYDQPNFDYNGNTIVDNTTYKVSEIDPIIVFATSVNTLSSDAFQPSYPKDTIKYDYSFNETERTNNPALGRITERIDEFGNRTDYDHRTILFKRYPSDFLDGTEPGVIVEVNAGAVSGVGTTFLTTFNVGDIVFIESEVPFYYEVQSIISNEEMTVVGFNYYNFFNENGYPYQITYREGKVTNGCLYYFNDVGNNYIDDGGNDMYDGGNQIYTNLFSQIPYTHTQMTDPPVNGNNQALFGDFTYDGSVQNGDFHFGLGSNYFTNLYPGLFVMSSYDIDITEFKIDGNLGSDGDGQADLFDYTLSYGGNDYSVYCKRVWAAQDPSVNHIFIVNTIDENITHSADLTTEDDLDTISNLSGATQVHYLLFGLAGGVKVTDIQIENVVNSYLGLIDPSDINNTLSNLNSGFTAITTNLPANNTTYKSLNYKQTNITGDTNNFVELLTFGSDVSARNTYIGNFADNALNNGFDFILSNNVFTNSYDNNVDIWDNNFGNVFVNNTFGDDVYLNEVSGGQMVNNLSYDRFDRNRIGSNFQNNIFYSLEFEQNLVGDNFSNNYFIGTNDVQNNLIGNNFTNNIFFSNSTFEKNQVGENFYYNKIKGNFEKNDILNEFVNNNILGTFMYNQIANNFSQNNIEDGFGFGISTTQGNVIGNNFTQNNIGEYFYNNRIVDNFASNTVLDYFQLNNVKCSVGFTDFSSANHVYGNYNCDLFLNDVSTIRLSFFSGDTLTVANITD